MDTVFNALNIFGIHDFGNILFTYFYVGLYVTIIEKTVIAIRGRNIRDCAKWLGVFGLWLLPSVAYRILDIIVPTGLPVQQRILVQGFRDALLPSIEHLDYGLGFVALGLFLYFVKKKTLQGIVYFLFCTVCMCGAAVARRNPDILINSAFATLYFDPMQCCMIWHCRLCCCIIKRKEKCKRILLLVLSYTSLFNHYNLCDVRILTFQWL